MYKFPDDTVKPISSYKGFEMGDTVEAFGRRGTITGIDTHIKVEFGEPETGFYERVFQMDGKYESWHVTPSLKVINRTKKFVKKIGYSALIPCSNAPNNHKYSLGFIFDSISACREYHKMGSRLEVIKVEYEAYE